MAAAGLTFCCGGLVKKAKYLRFDKWSSRTYSQQKTLKKSINYSKTVLLPYTQFPARHKPAKRVELDTEIAKTSQFDSLYSWQRENLKGPDFVLHDGPPYANGDPHMGHAINKILKDIAIRSRVICKQRVHYIPGWDCHGLPIELKALNAGKKPLSAKSNLSPIKLREIAQKFALDTAYKQRDIFRSWGVMADWNKQCYYTLDKSYVQNQLRQFYKMYEKGLIYRDMKPVYWSPSSGTALAEAELEYDPEHKSTEAYVELPFVKVSEKLKKLAAEEKLSAVIWTTTPWSLVGNQAVCYAPSLRYSALRGPNGHLLVVASSLIEEFCTKLGVNYEEVFTFEGGDLADCYYNHPLKSSMPLPLLPADHVSAEKGTGLVHTAPAHGPEDFLVALKYNIKVDCHVDEEGLFSDLPSSLSHLNGQAALGKGQDLVLHQLAPHLLKSGPLHHSYPLDWRTKQPLIIRASSQWFINTAGIREKAMSALENVTILPEASSAQHRAGLTAMVSGRPYWCISRQRSWGIPIPVLFLDDKPIISRELIDNICQMIGKEGPNSWWQNELNEFVPESLLKEHGTTVDRLSKGKDIMDIWLDSGLSWSSVLETGTADMYLEGLDQFTGWFQSSLLTSVALQDKAPYKTIFVHGFAVDGDGRKMSKSTGNVIDPKSITAGGKDQQKNPAYGVDTLRWWVASHGTQHSQVIISDKVISDSHTEVSRLRLLLKFILGAIGDLEQSIVEQQHQFGYLDAYMLHLLHNFQTESKRHYQSMRYNKVCSSILNFNANQISGLYCHVVKDRLYCTEKNSPQRRECQVVLNKILICLCQSLAPILPHLVEEVWSHHPLNANMTPFFQSMHEESKPIWNRPYVEDLMDCIFDIKKEVNKTTAGKNTFEFGCKIRANPEFFDRLMMMQQKALREDGELCEILQVSEVSLEEGEAFEDQWAVEVRPIEKLLCGRCRRYTALENDEPCQRCRTVMDGNGN